MDSYSPDCGSTALWFRSDVAKPCGVFSTRAGQGSSPNARDAGCDPLHSRRPLDAALEGLVHEVRSGVIEQNGENEGDQGEGRGVDDPRIAAFEQRAIGCGWSE